MVHDYALVQFCRVFSLLKAENYVVCVVKLLLIKLGSIKSQFLNACFYNQSFNMKIFFGVSVRYGCQFFEHQPP